MKLRTGSRFGNCVSIGLGNDGLSLKLWRGVFPFAPQMQIPWEQVAAIETRPDRFSDLLVITLSDGKSVSIIKRDQIASALSDKVTLLGMNKLYKQIQ